jgi:methionyl-tRNA synthetase
MTNGTKQRRWNAAVEKLAEATAEAEELLEEWRDWRERIPENLDDSPLAEALDEMIDIAEEFAGFATDADEWSEIEVPRVGMS